MGVLFEGKTATIVGVASVTWCMPWSHYVGRVPWEIFYGYVQRSRLFAKIALFRKRMRVGGMISSRITHNAR